MSCGRAVVVKRGYAGTLRTLLCMARRLVFETGVVMVACEVRKYFRASI